MFSRIDPGEALALTFNTVVGMVMGLVSLAIIGVMAMTIHGYIKVNDKVSQISANNPIITVHEILISDRKGCLVFVDQSGVNYSNSDPQCKRGAELVKSGQWKQYKANHWENSFFAFVIGIIVITIGYGYVGGRVPAGLVALAIPPLTRLYPLLIILFTLPAPIFFVWYTSGIGNSESWAKPDSSMFVGKMHGKTHQVCVKPDGTLLNCATTPNNSLVGYEQLFIQAYAVPPYYTRSAASSY